MSGFFFQIIVNSMRIKLSTQWSIIFHARRQTLSVRVCVLERGVSYLFHNSFCLCLPAMGQQIVADRLVGLISSFTWLTA